MNNIHKSIAVIILSAASITAFAKDKPMKMDMEMSEEMKDKQARDKQIYILKIDALSDQIQDEKNAKKKQVLMDEQLQLIKNHQEKKRVIKMKMMHKHMKMMNKKKPTNM